MAQIDAFNGAEGDADAQKRALLSTIAAQGSAGQAQFTAQQAAAQQAASQAVQGAAQRSNVIGAPQGLTDQLAGSGAGVGAAYAADAGAGSGMLGAVTQAGQQANSNYMDQLRAAIPLSRQLSDAYQKDAEKQAEQKSWMDALTRNDAQQQHQWSVEDRNYETASRAQQHQWDLEDRAAALELQKAKLANATGSGDPLASIVKQLGGNSLAKTQLVSLVNQAITSASQRKASLTPPNNYGSADSLERQAGNRQPQSLSPEERQAVIDDVGGQLGLQPGVLTQFLGKASQPAVVKPQKMSKTLSPQMTRELRAKPGYGHYANIINQQVTALRTVPKGTKAPDLGTVRKEVAATMRTSQAYKSEPLLFELLIRDYLGG